MDGGLSHGDDTDFSLGFGMNDDNYGIAKEAETDPSLFSVVEAGVFKYSRGSLKNLCRIGKIEFVPLQIAEAFVLIPREFHGYLYTYKYT
jgi:hypothetical protein